MCRGYFEVFFVNFWASYLLLPYWDLGWASSRIGRMPHSPDAKAGEFAPLFLHPLRGEAHLPAQDDVYVEIRTVGEKTSTAS